MRLSKKADLNKIVTFLFFGVLIIYFFQNQDALRELFAVPYWIVLALVILKATRILVTGLFTLFTLRAYGRKMKLTEANYVSLLSSIGNFFGPILGGASIRAVYLKKKYSLEYSKFISTLYGFYVITFITNAFLGVTLLAIFYSKFGIVAGFIPVLLVLLGILVSGFILILIPAQPLHALLQRIGFLPKRVVNIFSNIIDGWEVIRTDRPLLFKLFALNLAIFSLAFLESYFVFLPFVEDFTMLSVLLYTLLGTFSILVSFTPGAMGIKEALYIFTSGLIFISPTQVLQMATIDRGSSFILLFLAFIIIKVLKLDKNMKSERS